MAQWATVSAAARDPGRAGADGTAATQRSGWEFSGTCHRRQLSIARAGLQVSATHAVAIIEFSAPVRPVDCAAVELVTAAPVNGACEPIEFALGRVVRWSDTTFAFILAPVDAVDISRVRAVSLRFATGAVVGQGGEPLTRMAWTTATARFHRGFSRAAAESAALLLAHTYQAESPRDLKAALRRAAWGGFAALNEVAQQAALKDILRARDLVAVGSSLCGYARAVAHAITRAAVLFAGDPADVAAALDQVAPGRWRCLGPGGRRDVAEALFALRRQARGHRLPLSRQLLGRVLAYGAVNQAVRAGRPIAPALLAGELVRYYGPAERAALVARLAESGPFTSFDLYRRTVIRTASTLGGPRLTR